MLRPTLRRRLTVERLEGRELPSTLVAIHGTIQLTPASSSTGPGGRTTYTGSAVVTTDVLGTLSGSFTENIGPKHKHGGANLTVSGGGNQVTIHLGEGFKPANGHTQASVGLKSTGTQVIKHAGGGATGSTNLNTGAAQLTFTAIYRA